MSSTSAPTSNGSINGEDDRTPPSPLLISPSEHSVTLPDGTVHRYVLTSVVDGKAADGGDGGDDDRSGSPSISAWTEFCASVFSYKSNPPPPSYFTRHFYNDPRSDANLVRVLVHLGRGATNIGDECWGGDGIVSSVRIFRRTVSTGAERIRSAVAASTVEVGGIGEVCTSPSHQRRGLSKILLRDALRIMKADAGVSCSLLHASPDFRPVYQKAGGYKSVRSHWSVAAIQPGRLSASSSVAADDNGAGGGTIRRARFPEDAHRLMALHRDYSEERFSGCIVRSEDYWKNYVSAELGDTLWALETAGDGRENGVAKRTKKRKLNDEEGESSERERTIVAWLSVRKREGRFQLREFGVDRKGSKTSTSWALERLLGPALEQAGVEGVGTDNEAGCYGGGTTTSLHLPTFVVEEMREEASGAAFVDLEGIATENDDGWMYAVFDNFKPNIIELNTRGYTHLIWPTDSF